jgi:hypothetical protein
MAGRYAAQTEVPVSRSKAEIEETLARYGADQFYSGWTQRKATIGFRIEGLLVRIEMLLPDRADDRFVLTDTGKQRTDLQAQAAYDQALRQSWRALGLVIKAKLEAVAAGISTVEQEFLAHTVMTDGTTVGEWAAPQIREMYQSGKMPALLPCPQRSIEP